MVGGECSVSGAYGGGFPRFQETPLKTTKTNKILYSFID